MLRNICIAAIIALLGAGFYVTDLSPEAKACAAKGGRYDLTGGCWKITMTKLPG